MRSRVPAALLFAATALAAATADPWLRVKSDNFELFTTAGERGGRDLVRHLEQTRGFFLEAFGLAAARPVQVIAFGSEEEYRRYRPSPLASGFALSGPDHGFIVLQGWSSQVYPAAAHEYTHLVLGQSERRLPAWLEEGFAELFSNLEPARSEIAVGRIIPSHMQALRERKWVDLRALLSAAHDSPPFTDQSRVGMAYAESWLLVHMLNLDQRYSPRLRDLVDALGPVGSVAAFQRVYGKPVQELERDLHAYARAAGFHSTVFHLRLPKAGAAPQITAGEDYWARLALAELLDATRGRRGGAREAYAQIARDYPTRWEVERGWANSYWREGRPEEAARHFARALDLGATDAGLHLALGRALAFADRDDEAVAALKTAAELAPATDEAHYELAMALMRADEYRDALAEFTLVQHVDYNRASLYFEMQAYAHYQLGQPDQARAAIQQAKLNVRNQQEAEWLDILLRAVDTSPPVERPKPERMR